MKLTRSVVTVLAGLALVLTFPLLAQKVGSGSSEKACGIPNLTPEQAAKIEKLKVEHQKALVLLQADLKIKRLELRQLMLEKADQKKLEAKIDELAKVGAEIQKKCLAHRTDIGRLLTDEQKKAFDQKCGGMGYGTGMGHGDGCGGGGCRAHKMGKMGQDGHRHQGMRR
jgi:Spy/CpxP family protein refolding chaperone